MGKFLTVDTYIQTLSLGLSMKVPSLKGCIVNNRRPH